MIYPRSRSPTGDRQEWRALDRGMSSDRVVRLDPKSGNAVEYLMPSVTNMRTVYVDNSTTPVTFWVGSNHAHALVKVEPLD
jgi:virginiamycin B lyase